jgi:acetylglutamate kinase
VDDPVRLRDLAGQIASAGAQHQVTVVHGGGRQLTAFLDERGIASRFINGLRVTTTETIGAVLKILAGSVNKQLVAALRAAGANPVGISGVDGRLTTAVRMSEELEWVGRVTDADARLLHTLMDAAFLPVVACVAGDDQGNIWNINADQMATACARALAADQLIFLTDVAGVLDATGRLLPAIDLAQARELIASGVARGGMQAKLEAACAGIQGGVQSVVIAAGASQDIVARLLSGEAAGSRLSVSHEIEAIA